MHLFSQNIWLTTIVGFTFRIVVLYVGVHIDNQHIGGLNYTDIDYSVFTDAARLVAAGLSPYERATYRYPPIVAVLLSFSAHNEFGKVIFCIADVLIIPQLYSILHLTGPIDDAVWWAWLWAVNPASVIICTRGSADALTNWLVLAAISSLLQNSNLWSGVLLGAAVHLRLYPVIYLPTLVAHIWLRTGWSKLSAIPTEFHSRHLVRRSYSSALWQCLRFIVGFAAVLGGLTWWSYLRFGEPYLEHSLLYHVTRSDHRHNFSMHFLWTYLSRGARDSVLLAKWPPLWSGSGTFLSRSVDAWSATIWSHCSSNQVCNMAVLLAPKAMLFAPQILLLSMLGWAFAKDSLVACLLLQTAVFVSCNKVVTAQYFTWVLCLVPIAAPAMRRVSLSVPMGCAALWGCSLAAWLCCAYFLEFSGANHFHELWLCSLLFHATTTLCIAAAVWYVE